MSCRTASEGSGINRETRPEALPLAGCFHRGCLLRAKNVIQSKRDLVNVTEGKHLREMVGNARTEQSHVRSFNCGGCRFV